MDSLRQGCAGNEMGEQIRVLVCKNKKTAMALRESASRNLIIRSRRNGVNEVLPPNFTLVPA
jgi:hypothetical protein